MPLAAVWWSLPPEPSSGRLILSYAPGRGSALAAAMKPFGRPKAESLGAGRLKNKGTLGQRCHGRFCCSYRTY